jgi:tetratricopeptide (TPR) repeat protein
MKVPEVLALVEKHRVEGRLAEADGLCRQILAARPGHAEALHLLGIVTHDAGKPDEAIDLVRQAIASEPRVPLYHSNLCEMCRLAKRTDEAVAAGRLAIALAPNYPQALNNLGIAYFDSGDFEAAADSYKRALALMPDFAEAHSNLGNALRALKRFEEAIDAHKQALRLKPGYGDGYNNLGTVLRDLKRFAEADENYRKALSLKPRDPAILNNLALSATQQKRYDDALALLTSSASIDPKNHETFNFLASLWIERSDLAKAKSAVDRALMLKPDFPEAFNVLGRITFEEGRTADAVELYRKAIALKPELADAYNNLGNSLKELGRFDEARDAYEEALKLDATSTAVFVNLADARRFKPDDPYIGQMEALLGKPDSTEEEQTQLHFALGKAFADLKQHDKSLKHFIAGGVLKRKDVPYDEPAMMALFDRIKAVFSRDLVRRSGGLGDPSTLPVFVIGMPRSGTTLVEQIVSSHPKVFGAGELPDLSAVITAVHTYGGQPVPYPEFVPTMGPQQLRQFGGAYISRVRQRSATAERITDKLPANFLYLGLAHLAMPNARFIHVRRNPVDTCVSCFSKLFTGEQAHTYDLAELGRYYRAYEALMEHWHKVLPAGVMMDVQYEDVVADIETQARRIVAHVGLEWDEACLAFYENDRPIRTASATQVRQPIYNSSIGRWRAYGDLLEPLTTALGIDPKAA